MKSLPLMDRFICGTTVIMTAIVGKSGEIDDVGLA
jgi:hypothetical protein